METPKMTLKQAAEQALMVQDACNASGVINSFHRIMSEVLFPSFPTTKERNQHPIVFMFAYKLLALSGHEPVSGCWEAYTEATRACEAIVAAEEAVAAA